MVVVEMEEEVAVYMSREGETRAVTGPAPSTLCV